MAHAVFLNHDVGLAIYIIVIIIIYYCTCRRYPSMQQPVAT